VCLAAGIAAAACEFNEITVSRGEDQPVVHSVLNPNAIDEAVLVERVLTGAVLIDDRRYNRADPIATGSGDPVRGARVVVYGPKGDSVVAIEDALTRQDGRGAGVYRFKNGTVPGGLAILPGATYRLRVTTLLGVVVTGTTTVPSVPLVANEVLVRYMNRDRDTLHLFWDAITGTSRYAIRIDGATGSFALYTAELEASLPGTLRNIFQDNFPRMFVPGFQNRVDVVAIDANYFDYYRSGNDPFTGTGLINHLEGGLGLFGSVAALYTYSVVVDANFVKPVEGIYTLIGGGSSNLVPGTMTLYVDEENDQTAHLTGVYQLSTGAEAGIVGSLSGTQIYLAFLDSPTEFRDTLVTFAGQFAHDSLLGTARRRNLSELVRFAKK
jgi:hypothetical protein